jgi:hypothetical protein
MNIGMDAPSVVAEPVTPVLGPASEAPSCARTGSEACAAAVCSALSDVLARDDELQAAPTAAAKTTAAALFPGPKRIARTDAMANLAPTEKSGLDL